MSQSELGPLNKRWRLLFLRLLFDSTNAYARLPSCMKMSDWLVMDFYGLHPKPKTSTVLLWWVFFSHERRNVSFFRPKNEKKNSSEAVMHKRQIEEESKIYLTLQKKNLKEEGAGGGGGGGGQGLVWLTSQSYSLIKRDAVWRGNSLKLMVTCTNTKYIWMSNFCFCGAKMLWWSQDYCFMLLIFFLGSGTVSIMLKLAFKFQIEQNQFKM